MNAKEINIQLLALERIRDIFLENGITSIEIDKAFQRICSDIDFLLVLLHP